MRARGAKATDIAVLVVAADDGVMAQTVEAIDHIKAAGIPMIVAINKIDKPNADVDKVLNDLVRQGLTPEVWGGETITVEVSALQGKNIDELLEMILLVAEMEDLRADPNGPFSAVIIESHLSAGQGPVASAVIKDGTLHEKDWVVAGAAHGRVRALIDDRGNRVKEARPGEAVGILGFNRVPPVGAEITVVRDQAEARRLAEEQEESRPRRTVRRPTSFEELFEAGEEVEKVRLILKAATSGALEAARREIDGIDVEGVEVEILHAGVGVISESDVLLAASVTEECPVVGFGVKADGKARKLRRRRGEGHVQGSDRRCGRMLRRRREGGARERRARPEGRGDGLRRGDRLVAAVRGRRARGPGRPGVRDQDKGFRRRQGRGSPLHLRA